MIMAKTTCISVYEHDRLKLGETEQFLPEHLSLLQQYLGEKDTEVFPYYQLINNGVKFKQYVGVLCVGNLQIEVLPKIEKQVAKGEEGTWRNHLLEMLRTVFKLQTRTPSNADQAMRESAILDVFLVKFLNEVEALLHKGLIKTYRKTEENRTSMKGKLVFSKHLTKNYVHKERFYVNYTTYDRNHILNCILYKALKLVSHIAMNSYTQCRAKTMSFEFPELNDIAVDDALFERLTFDRKSEDYRTAIDIARLILQRYMPDQSKRGKHVLALMFDMNKLWEEYVFVILRRSLREEYKVSAQKVKRFWESSFGTKVIRPDIVVSDKSGKPVCVLDTKWKCPAVGEPPSDADLKQMYVYHKYWGVERTALLYPSTKDDELSGYFQSGYFAKTPDNSDKLSCSKIYLSLSILKNSQYECLKLLICNEEGEQTGVEDVAASKQVASVEYYSVSGIKNAEPVDGVNIKVVRYTDGSLQTSKFVK